MTITALAILFVALMLGLAAWSEVSARRKDRTDHAWKLSVWIAVEEGEKQQRTLKRDLGLLTGRIAMLESGVPMTLPGAAPPAALAAAGDEARAFAGMQDGLERLAARVTALEARRAPAPPPEPAAAEGTRPSVDSDEITQIGTLPGVAIRRAPTAAIPPPPPRPLTGGQAA
jgi:hypothetical protein